LKNVKVILQYVRTYKGYALLNVVNNILSVVFSLFSLAMIKPVLDLLFDKTNTQYQFEPLRISGEVLKNDFYYYINEFIKTNGKINALLMLCVVVAIMAFFKNFFRYLAMYYLAPVRNGVIRDLRKRMYDKILALPLSYFSEERKGDLIARMTSDVQEVEWSIMTTLEVMFREPFTIVLFVGTMIAMSPSLTLFVVILLPLTGLLIGRIGKSLKKNSIKAQAIIGSLLSVIEETLSGLRIIKAFTAERFSTARFQGINDSLTKLMIRMYRKRDLSSPLSEFLGVTVMVIVMYYGGQLVLNDKLDSAVFIAYLAIFSQLLTPIKSFASAYYSIQKGMASSDRINKILHAENTIIEIPNALAVKEFKAKIEYRNVSFSYRTDADSEPVLKNINLTIDKGKTIALVGASGGGKSTLADLLPRFYDVTAGDISIDGISLRDMKLNDLRRLMGVVTQESILFNDSVFNNIAFGMENVKEEAVINASKIANAHDFIMEMENGYQTNIGDRGLKLSGGQRQRLSIARAILKNPPILILDEATSALDTESERLVQDALIKLMENRTSLVIAHRLSTIQHADEIIVLQRGEIVERGTHHELLKLEGVYKKLYDMQSFI
jgi:subfamily B ATP-binding cassette protein MsbA